MKYRKLRIAWSVAWGVVCLLLIALWVRSHWWCDSLKVRISATYVVGFGSSDGTACVSKFAEKTFPKTWAHYVVPARGFVQADDGVHYSIGNIVSISFWETNNTTFYAAYWFLTLLLSSLAAAPWIRSLPWRFSLRTLLIAMTVAAIGLGWIVYAIRR